MTIIAAWLLADFIAGVFHWLEDKFLLEESQWGFLETIRRDNDLHHRYPTAMCALPFWENIQISALISWPLSTFLWSLGVPNIIWLAILFASLANGIHRYAHMPKARVPKVVRWLQYTGLFISFDHHTEHHFGADGVIEKQDTTKRYCPMTNWVNPILDAIQFWKMLEWIFV